MGSSAPSRCGPEPSATVKAGHLRDGDPLPWGGHTRGRRRYEESERTNQGTRRYPAPSLASGKHFVRRDCCCSQSTHCGLPRCVGTTPGPGRTSLGPWSPSKPSVLEVLDYTGQCLSHLLGLRPPSARHWLVQDLNLTLPVRLWSSGSRADWTRPLL